MVVLFLSVAAGLQAGQELYGLGITEYNWEIAAPYIVGGIVTFAFFLGLSEIIRLLNGIHEKLKKENNS